MCSPTQHYLRRENDRTRVDLVLTGVLRRSTVSGLEHCHRIRQVGPRRNADTPDLGRQGVGGAAEAELYRMEAEWEAAYWLAMKAAWMADNKLPNSREASMAKAKAGRVASEVTLKCVELAGASGYAEDELLEKWARDSKILDIFEGTQQIQLLIVARRLLGKSSSELK